MPEIVHQALGFRKQTRVSPPGHFPTRPASSGFNILIMRSVPGKRVVAVTAVVAALVLLSTGFLFRHRLAEEYLAAGVEESAGGTEAVGGKTPPAYALEKNSKSNGGYLEAGEDGEAGPDPVDDAAATATSP